ncbi:glycoside hydrolase family 108 protein [candidate division KSB1 bacterium]
MAQFDPALKKTLNHEGGYVDDPDDPGGETYKGISRKHHPDWTGWQVIDGVKQANPGAAQIDELLQQNDALNDHIGLFYRSHYWNSIRGDDITSQPVAEELFDIAVNMGVRTAVRFLQETLNLLNRNQKNYEDIVEDGIIGINTLNTLSELLALEHNDPSLLLKVINILRGDHYIAIMRKNPVQEKYARGWLKRVQINNI